MAKKKGFKKRNKKVSAQPKPVVASQSNAEATASANPVSATQVKDQKLAYVQSDLKRITILVGGFVIAQLALSYLLSNTSLGPTVYSLIKI